MLKIIPIPALADNYIWAVCNESTKRMAIVDPGEAAPVLEFLDTQKMQLSAILVTHHHHDHTGGIPELLDHCKVPVLSTETLKSISSIFLPEINLSLNVIAIPGHTLDHIAFYNDQILFCGDTLFCGGCGRIFEGSAQQMFNSLQQLKVLNPKTLVYCAHEYTEKNLRFALLVEPENVILQRRLVDTLNLRNANKPSVPSLLDLELETNPFLRTHQPAIQSAVIKHCGRHLSDEIEIFSELRKWKNNY